MRPEEWQGFLVDRLRDLGDALLFSRPASLETDSSDGVESGACNAGAELRSEGKTRRVEKISIDGHDFELLTPRVSMADVVLPKGSRSVIQAHLQQGVNADLLFSEWGLAPVVEKGHGMTFLFYGVPGTGKTMTAEAIAHSLGKRYIVVGTAELESSRPGEFERTLTSLFSHAKSSGHVLVLDECDSLLYSRSQVGHIEGAEINHLLDLLEECGGVVVLTTNREPVLDPALARRIAVKLEFPHPDYEARLSIWERFLSTKVPRESMVWAPHLALFPLTGGQMRSVFLGACRRAAMRSPKRAMVIDFYAEMTAEFRYAARTARQLSSQEEGGKERGKSRRMVLG